MQVTGNFAKSLKSYRKAFLPNMTRTELARRIGVHPSYIMQIEKGVHNPPPIKRLKQIIALLGVNQNQADELILNAIKERLGPSFDDIERIVRKKIGHECIYQQGKPMKSKPKKTVKTIKEVEKTNPLIIAINCGW